MRIGWTPLKTTLLLAPREGASNALSAPGPVESVELGGSTADPTAQMSRAAARLKAVESAAMLKADIEVLYEKILSDENHAAKQDQWRALIGQAERYLAMPDSFDGPDFGPLSRTKTNDPHVTFVCLRAPTPNLAGTMSRNWNYIQTKTADGVHLQRLGADEVTNVRDAHLWKNGAEEGMTVLGVAVGSTRDVYPVATVYTRQGGDWQPVKDRFTCNTGNLEGHTLFLGEDGSLCIEEDWFKPGYLEMAFDGDTNRVLITGGQEPYALEFANGKYSLYVDPPEEKKRKEHERELGRMVDALDHSSTGGAITRDGNTVSIGGVKLPVRRIG